MGFDIAPLWVVSMATDVMGSSLIILNLLATSETPKI